MVVDTVLNELTQASQDEKDATQDESTSDVGEKDMSSDERAEEIDVEISGKGRE